jgi:hypothetical protein
MARRTIADRIAEFDQPDMRTDEEEIWGVVRAILNVCRVVVFLAIIVVSEMLEEMFFKGLSLGIWSLIIGIPCFIALSVSILMGDSWFTEDEDKETAVVRPIHQRI